jgi:hypothetical protein
MLRSGKPFPSRAHPAHRETRNHVVVAAKDRFAGENLRVEHDALVRGRS